MQAELSASRLSSEGIARASILAAVLALGLASAIAQGVLIATAPVPARDCMVYIGEAQQIWRLGIRTALTAQPAEPLFPSLVAFNYGLLSRIWGQSPTIWVISAQLVAGTSLVFATVLLFLLSLPVVGFWGAIVAASFFAVLPEVARLGAAGITDALHIALFCLGYWAIIRYLMPAPGQVLASDPTPPHAATSGVDASARCLSTHLSGNGAFKVTGSPFWLLLAGLATACAVLTRRESLVLVGVTTLWLIGRGFWGFFCETAPHASRLHTKRDQKKWEGGGLPRITTLSRLLMRYGVPMISWFAGLAIPWGIYFQVVGAVSPAMMIRRLLESPSMAWSWVNPPDLNSISPSWLLPGKVGEHAFLELVRLSPQADTEQVEKCRSALRLDPAAEVEPVDFRWFNREDVPSCSGLTRAFWRFVKEFCDLLGYVPIAFAVVGFISVLHRLMVCETFALCLAVAFALAIMVFSAANGYLEARHLLTLGVLAIPLVPLGIERAFKKGRCLTIVLILLSLGIILHEYQAKLPLNHRDAAHRQASFFLRQLPSEESWVIDTQRFASFWAEKRLCPYEFSYPFLGVPNVHYLVLERRDLKYTNPRSAALRLMVAVAAEPIAVFGPKSDLNEKRFQHLGARTNWWGIRADTNTVIVYRWDPLRWRRWWLSRLKQTDDAADDRAPLVAEKPALSR